jgi:multiple sugar transport system permease protein
LAVACVLSCLCGGAFSSTERVTIRTLTGLNADNLRLYKRTAAEFEAAHPNIHIEVDAGVDMNDNKVLAMVAAGVEPDVVGIDPNYFATYADKNILLPLDSFPDLNGSEANLKGRYANAVASYSWHGRLYVLPRDVSCTAYIFYNKKLFREAGVPYPDGTWTWDTHVRKELRERDFAWVMDQLTKRHAGESRPYQYAFAASWPELYLDALFFSSNVRLWDDDEHPTKLYLDKPEVRQILQFAADGARKYRWIPNADDINMGAGSSIQDEFRKGHIAMVMSGSWEVKDMRHKWDGDWDIAAFPRYAHAETSYLPGEGTGLAIMRTSKHPKEAWEWVKWYCGPHGLIPMAQAGESQPSIRSLAREPGIWLPAKDAVGRERMPEHLSICDETALRVKNRRLPDYFNSIYGDIEGVYGDVLRGIRPVDVALSKLQREEPGRLKLALAHVDSPRYPFWPATAVGVALALGLLAWIYLPEIRKGLPKTRMAKAENRSAYLFLIPWICGLAMTVGPMIYSLLLSLSDSNIIQTPRWRGLGNYVDAFSPAVDDTLFVSLRQTFLYAAMSIPLGISVALGLALLLNRPIKGVALYRAIYYIPSLASAVAISLVWMKLFDKDHGLINAILYGIDGRNGLFHLGPLLSRWVGTPGEPISWLGNPKTVLPAFVMMGLWGAGGGTIIFLAALQGIPASYLEAATLDGAGAIRKFRSVILPLLSPALFFSLITGVIGALQFFSQAFVITSGGPDRATLFYMVWVYQKAFQDLKMGYASALAWILFVIILFFTLLQVKWAKNWVHYEGELR